MSERNPSTSTLEDTIAHLQACANDPEFHRPRKVAVVGSRGFAYADLVLGYVGRLPMDWTVVTGGAPGVDTWAEQAARARGMAVEVFPADWGKHGRSAGAIRNRQIVDACDWVVAFWDGTSPGTKITMDLARKAGKLRQTFRLPSRPNPLEDA